MRFSRLHLAAQEALHSLGVDRVQLAKEVEQLEADVETMKDKHSAKEMHQMHQVHQTTSIQTSNPQQLLQEYH